MPSRRLVPVIAGLILPALLAFLTAATAHADPIDYSQHRHWSGLIPWTGGATVLERFELWGTEYCLAAGFQQGCVFYDMTDPANPDQVGSVHALGPEMDAAVREWQVFVATGVQGLSRLTIIDPANPSESAALVLPGEALKVALAGDYVLVACREGGLAVVWSPVSGQLLPAVTVQLAAEVLSVAVAGDLAVVGLASGGVVTLDIADPLAPVELGTWPHIDGVADLAIVGERVVAVYDNTSVPGVVLDISDPAQPVFVADIPGTGWGASAVAVAGDEVLVSGNLGVIALPVAELDAPRVVFSQRIHHDGEAVAGGADWLLVANERGLETFHGAPPGPPAPYATVPIAGADELLLHGDVLIACREEGLTLVDVAEPTAPVVLASLALPGSVAWVLEDDMLWIFRGWYDPGLTGVDIADPAAAYVRTQYYVNVASGGFTVHAGHAYVPLNDAGFAMQVIDVTDPDAPQGLGTFSAGGSLRELVAHRDHLVGRRWGYSQLAVFDAADPAQPEYLDSVYLATGSGRLSLDGDRLAVPRSHEDSYVDIFDLSDPTDPHLLGTVGDLPGHAYQARLTGGLVYAVPPGPVFDVHDPAHPVSVGSIGNLLAPYQINDVAADGDALYYAYDGGPVVIAPAVRQTVTAVDHGGGTPRVSAPVVRATPNPFNPRVTIAYELPAAGGVVVDILDVRGHHVRRVAHGHCDAGRHEVRWDGRHEDGRPAAAGIYLARVSTPWGDAAAKLALVR